MLRKGLDIGRGFSRAARNGNIQIFKRTVVTAAEQNMASAYETPVPDGSALMRTSYESMQSLTRANPSFAAEIRDVQDGPNGTNLFFLRNVLWATSVDATNPDRLLQVVEIGAEILGVRKEDLGDTLCVKNLNCPSNNREDNIELHARVIYALNAIRARNPDLFKTIQVTSNAANPKFSRDDLKKVVRDNGATILGEKSVRVTSEDNLREGSTEPPESLQHQSETVTIELGTSTTETKD